MSKAMTAGPSLAQPVDKLRDNGARPGPLADLVEAGVIDIDDAYRHVPRLARGGLLIEAEAKQRQPLKQIGSRDAPGARDEQQRERQEIDHAAAKREVNSHRWLMRNSAPIIVESIEFSILVLRLKRSIRKPTQRASGYADTRVARAIYQIDKYCRL
jgi:hypothetical protein